MSAPSSLPARVCSCGVSVRHIVAERLTSDGVRVLVWSDGALTDRVGHLVRGRVPRNRLFLAADEIGIVTWDELPALVAATKRASTPREVLAALPRPRPTREQMERQCAVNAAERMRALRAHLDICRTVHCRICGGAS